jgi:hypothetical protein
MGKQLMFAAGVAVGYVLGARAGRDRYEAIMRSMRELKERPEFQEAAGVVTAQAGQIAGSLADRARDVMGGARPGGVASDIDSGDAWTTGRPSPAAEGPAEKTA